LSTAAALIEERGYHAPKTATIAERVGVRVCSFCQFFPSSYAVLTVLVECWLVADDVALAEVESGVLPIS